LISCGKWGRSVDLGPVEEGAITGSKIPEVPSVTFGIDLGMPSTCPLIGYWDYGSPVTLANGETFTIDFGASILTLA
jgi:hypothetical protein